MNNTAHSISIKFIFVISVLFLCLLHSTTAFAANARSQGIVKHWSAERMANAIPRDLVIDGHGQGYLRRPDGSLVPYGNRGAKQLREVKQTPFAKPPGAGSGSGDTTPPVISNMSPAEGETITSSHIFSTTVTDDASGVKSVSFVITYPDGINTQTFSAGYAGNNIWQVSLQGFSDGNWSWQVEAKDGASKGGNLAVSDSINFIVGNGGSSGGGGGDTGSHVVTNSPWSAGGSIQTAAGRIFFEMPNNAKRKGPWSGYVCSGTVATDETTGRSIIITAAHCVFDDANSSFARNVLFIPNQAGTTGSGTDTNCNNDPLGCWTPDFGVVDVNWSTNVFPANIEWDYAYYVVNDTGAHTGNGANPVLDSAAGALSINFNPPYFDDGDPTASSVDFTHALGYSYSEDPNFMYCAEDMTTEGTVNWWLANCGLSGGSSGGPWIQKMDESTGSGPIISVNSWGYTTSPGMAGPKLSGSSASCLFTIAVSTDFLSITSIDGDEGVVVNSCP